MMTQTTKGGARLAAEESDALSPGSKALIALAAVLGAALLTLGAFCAVAAASNTVYPRTTVLGNEVGGLTVEEAAQRLAPLLPQAYDQNGIPLLLDGEEVLLATLSDLGLSPEAEQCAQLAYAAGRSGNLLMDGIGYVAALLRVQEVTPTLDLGTAAVQRAVEQIAQQIEREAQPLRYELREDDLSHIALTKAQTGIALDREALTQQLRERLHSGDLSAIDCAYDALPYDSAITLDSIAQELLGECQNAGYDSASGSITEERIGVFFDTEQARTLLQNAAEGETVLVDARVQFPTVYAKDLTEDVLFRDLLASYSTKLTGSAARISNVRLAANACNGTVLNTGDEFSFNGVVGKRTAARGYLPAPAYLAGETVDTIGGGICQVSSTLYAACLHANLAITDRTAHRYVSSYIPNGLDATVSWGTLDYKFQNNTNYPIRIVATTENGKLHVQLYGTKTDESYVVITSETYGATGYETVYQDTPDLPAGTEQVKQTPYSGCKVQTYRNVYAADGTLLSSTAEALSHYKSRNKIILRGTAASSTITPAPAPDDDDGSGELDGFFDPSVPSDDTTILPGFNGDDDASTGKNDELIDTGEDWIF